MEGSVLEWLAIGIALASAIGSALVGVYKFGQQGQKLQAVVTEVERMKADHPEEMRERDLRRKEEREQVEDWHQKQMELMKANYDQRIEAAQKQFDQQVALLTNLIKDNRAMFQTHIEDSKESRMDIKAIREDVSEVKADMAGVKATLTSHMDDHNGKDSD